MGDLPLVIAFVILAAYTYNSGLRAPALIALVKDVLIYVTVIAAVIVIPRHLGGYAAIFRRFRTSKLLLAPPAAGTLGSLSAYATLALGSALALFLYPHAVTGLLSGEQPQRHQAQHGAAAGLLGRARAASRCSATWPSPPACRRSPEYAAYFAHYGPNFAVPALFLDQFPAWFVGVAFAAVAIGALVPAAIMSIAAANLFTRNIYRDLFPPVAQRRRQRRRAAKRVSLVIKAGALVFIIFLPTSTRSSSSCSAASGSSRRSRPSCSGCSRAGSTAAR